MNLQQIKNFLNKNYEKVFLKLQMSCDYSGDNIYCVCPVHESSDNPKAFSFCKKRYMWRCWTRECQNIYKNDLLGLIRGVLSNKEGRDIDFNDVLSWVSKEFKIKTNTQQMNIMNHEEENDFDILIRQLKEDILIKEPATYDLDIRYDIPSQYFLNRGFDKKTLEFFEVGDCLDKKSKLYDRAIIPIYNDDGSNKIGIIARSIKEYKMPKFLIYPKGFDKKFIFYNLNNAINEIRKTNTIFVVEGQGDVWKLHEAGIHNAVGIFGRVLSTGQQKKLQTLPITRIIILTDNDQAGRESKIQLQRQLGRFYKLNFPKLSCKDIGDMTSDEIKKDILPQL